MQQLILLVHVLTCIALVALILLQHGKGADIGAAFGSGASQTVFGSQGSGSFLLKITAVLATLFFITSLSLGFIAGQESKAHNGQGAPVTQPIGSGSNQPAQPSKP